MSLEIKQESKTKKDKIDKNENLDKSEKNDRLDISKNILNKVSYLMNKKLNNINLNKIDIIFENIQILLNEYEKQNKFLYNKIDVLENLLILVNKDINDLKKKIKSKNYMNSVSSNNLNLLSEKIKKKELDSDDNHELIETNELNYKNINESNDNLNEDIPIMKVNSFSNFYKDIKKEKLELDNNFVKKCLESHNINSDLKIFKKIYIDDIPSSSYSIRTIKDNYQYWLNNKMNDDDENGTYIKDIIIHNISNIYLEVNNFDDYLEDNDLFIKNQEYILNMSKQKYKDRLFNNILKIIKD